MTAARTRATLYVAVRRGENRHFAEAAEYRLLRAPSSHPPREARERRAVRGRWPGREVPAWEGAVLCATSVAPLVWQHYARSRHTGLFLLRPCPTGAARAVPKNTSPTKAARNGFRAPRRVGGVDQSVSRRYHPAAGCPPGFGECPRRREVVVVAAAGGGHHGRAACLLYLAVAATGQLLVTAMLGIRKTFSCCVGRSVVASMATRGPFRTPLQNYS